jgi:hypothetical protein
MLFQDVTNGRVRDVIADIVQRALNPVITPGRILPGKPQSEVDDDLTDFRSACFLLPAIRIIPLVRDQLSMPTQDCIRSEQRAKQFELPASKNFSFNGESSPLVVAEQDAFPTELLFLRTAFSVRRYSITSCCWRLIQLARITTNNCHG